LNSRNTFYTINLTLVFILTVAIVRTFILPENLTIPKTTSAGTTSVPDPSQGPSNLQNNSPSDNYSNIIESPLFNSQNSGDSTSQQIVTATAINPPDLKLTGTVAGPPSIARAIIDDLTTHQTHICKTGETIAQATIVSIEKNQVILSIGGKKFTLHQSSGESRTPAQRSSKRIEKKRTTQISLQPSPPRHRAELFDEIMKTATFEPHIINDQSQGLKIKGLESTLITGFLGLQNGDIIQTVNGQKFTNKQKAFQVLKKARTQSHIEIQLIRDNQPKTLTFPLR